MVEQLSFITLSEDVLNIIVSLVSSLTFELQQSAVMTLTIDSSIRSLLDLSEICRSSPNSVNNWRILCFIAR